MSADDASASASFPAATALIAEDEAPQRRALREALAVQWPQLRIVAECEDGIAALEALAVHRPQVAFLDIRMPGVTGLDVARTAVAAGAQVVFTTAYDAYAVRAFETGAVDYLLKPLQPARLRDAVARLHARLREAGAGAQAARIDALEAALRPQGAQAIRWIAASAGDTVRMLGVDDVLFFQAQDKYVRVVSADGEAVIRTPLKDLLAGLDPDAFWQVHRGTIVRVAAIDRVRRDELGRHRLHLRGHTETLPVSPAFLHRFRGM